MGDNKIYSYIDKDAKKGIINEYALEDYFKEVMKYVKLKNMTKICKSNLFNSNVR